MRSACGAGGKETEERRAIDYKPELSHALGSDDVGFDFISRMETAVLADMPDRFNNLTGFLLSIFKMLYSITVL